MSYMQVRNMIKVVYVIGFILLALVFEGLRRKIIARMHNRAGPPFIQPFYDVLKLFEKEKAPYKNIIFNSVPYLALICSLFMLLIIPFSIFSFDFDFLVLGYVFILQDTFYILGAIASRSPFGMYASVRELLLMLGYEIAFIIVLSAFFFAGGVTSFANYTVEMAFMNPFVALASVLLIYVAFVILRVTPYDVMVAESEISAGFFSEYSGRSLAILEIAEFIKDLVVYMLLGFLIVGSKWALPLAPLFMLFYAAMQASSPRYSTLVTVRTFLFVAVIAFITLFLVGVSW